MAIEGGCLCGKVRYRVSAPLLEVDHCHCSMCRRQHGAAFASYASFAPTSFEWTKGEHAVNLFEPDPSGGWCFCNLCGSTLAGTYEGEIVSITLGTVDGDPGTDPGFHIFVGSKAPWHDITDDLKQYEERPE